MKKKELFIATVLLSLLFNGCSTKEVQPLKSIKKSEVAKSLTKTEKRMKEESDVEVEVIPVSDKKIEVVTKIKPEIDIVEKEKLDKGEIPIVVVDPVDKDVPLKEVEILPVVDDTVGVVTKVKPTVEIVEEIPLEDEVSAVIIEPVVE